MSLRTLQLGMEWFPEQPGGLNRFFFDLARHLPATGVEVRGLVTGAATGEQDGIRTFAPSGAPLWRRWLGARRAVRQALAQERFDLAASHFALYTFPVLDLLAGLPLVIHFQGPWSLESKVEGVGQVRRLVRQSLERAVYRRANRCIVLSEAFGALLRDGYGIPAQRIRVIPGAVDLARFSPDTDRRAARARLGWPLERPLVLAVRRLARRMGLENLIQAMDEVRARIPGVLLLLAGEGPLAAELSKRIEAAGLASHARLLGLVPEADLPLAYRAADLTVVPTVALEGFGLSAVESLACGTPVLATPVGGTPEILRPLMPALVLPDSSIGALAGGIAAALEGQLALPDEERCRAYAAERYGWPRIAVAIRDVYAEALAEAPRA